MPQTEEELAIIEAAQNLDHGQRFDTSPTKRQRLGRFTVVCLILNRTIGSGIYVVPAKVLAGTGSTGGLLLFWVAGALISICGLFVWLECAMSIPQRPVRGETEPRGVPRSGGEKNYLEFFFAAKQSRTTYKQSRTTYIYGIMFTLLGNLSGNAIAFGIYVLEAANQYDPTAKNGPAAEPNHGAVIGIAIGALTVAILLHICSRRGGIYVNNGFAVVKVLLLLVLICIGLAKAGGAFKNVSIADPHNFNLNTSFSTRRHDVASYSNSLLYVLYTYSGFEQPFYVLSEVRSPRKVFPTWTLTAMGIASFLFIMMNVAYLFAVQKTNIIDNSSVDMATVFLEGVFGTTSAARRAMAALIAFSIFGNIVVMTFTAARVKQEIAKEGIFSSWSIFLATSHTTPLARLFRSLGWTKTNDGEDRLEQTPMAALGLHWLTSVILILVTIPAKPTTAYNILVSLYSYAIIVLVGAWVSFGLLLTKIWTNKFHWKARRRYRPFISPIHVIVYFSSLCFVLVCVFVPPASGSPYAANLSGIKSYIIPSIGITAPFWGLCWYYIFMWYQKRINWTLDVDRKAFWDRDPDNPREYIQRAEVVSHRWIPRGLTQKRKSSPSSESRGENEPEQPVGRPNVHGTHVHNHDNGQMQSFDPRDHIGSLVL